MNPNQKKLVDTLKHIFQIDRGDLDFGIYRILNQKHQEITQFLDKDLMPQVKKELDAYEAGDHVAVQRELDEKIASFKTEGFTDEQIESNAKIQELRSKLRSAGHVAELEGEIFSHLVRFFERYYEEGDFISKRRYKDGVYAIPYEGEEVKLYWANHDQYYIKTSEQFKNFSFKVGEKRVHFRIKEAETDANNNKNVTGKDRRFVLVQDGFFEEKEGELDLYFEYISVEGKKKQDECNTESTKRILEGIPAAWRTVLAASAPTENNAERTVLDKFLTSYTARNTFDYFIHKDLSGFLTRELDFYIKNEVMFLDDIESESAPRAEQYLSKVKVIRAIAKKIIRMLAQLEDFQKKLWEKKKFVVGTGYCITLDLIPEKYYDAILESDAQKAEWKKLGFIVDSTELTSDYLKSHPTLSIDTKFFPEWRDELLAHFDNLEERVNGVIINSENFGALNLLQERYREQIKSIYIDPPYNTDASKILYKNDYEHASWLSLMIPRVAASSNLLNREGIIELAIDDYEYRYLHASLEGVFGSSNHIGNIAIMNNPKGRDQTHIASAHEYLIFFAKDKKAATTNPLRLTTDEIAEKYPEMDADGNRYRELPLRRSGSGASREDRPNMYFPFLRQSDGSLSVLTDEEYKKIYDRKSHRFNDEYVQKLKDKYETQGVSFILPIREDGTLGRWRWGIDNVREVLVDRVHGGDLFSKSNGKGEYVIYQIDRARPTFKAKSLWYGENHDSSTKGTNLVKNMFGSKSFDYPKSLLSVIDAIEITSSPGHLILDYFAGSGTTAHAVLELNKKEQQLSASGKTMQPRRYILVEMGLYFDQVTKPRVLKAVYSSDWYKGEPEDDGVSGTREHIIKYFKLESYEDSLNNLAITRSNGQQATLDQHAAFREEYMLGYMLDVETKDSVLRVNSFSNPFKYTLKLSTDIVGESHETPVDLVETFNYLIGLKVSYLRRHNADLLVVEGETRDGDKTLVIWRNQEAVDNTALNEFFDKQKYSSLDSEFKRIYVNGDNNLENIKVEGKDWKVITIEEEFHKRMFA